MQKARILQTDCLIIMVLTELIQCVMNLVGVGSETSANDSLQD